jgi:hypothetical protein
LTPPFNWLAIASAGAGAGAAFLSIMATLFIQLPSHVISWVIVWAWLAAGLISSALAILQYFGAASDFSPWINQTRYGEAFANQPQRNQFATLTTISLSALLWLFCAASKPAQELAKGAYKKVAWGCLAASLLMIGNAASSSRTGLFELVFLCALCGMWG